MAVNYIKELKNKKKRERKSTEWYSLRPLLGYTDCMFYVIIGARERGKSYAIMEYCLRQWKRLKKPFTWMRLTEASTKKMLQNNAAQFVDADLYRKYDLELTVKGQRVYDHGELMATILALSTAFNDKGVAHFDKDWDGGYNIVLDEFQLERGQRRTVDFFYNLTVQLENLVRSQKDKVRIFMIANSTSECDEMLSMGFNFIPQEFGIYHLASKRCVMDYIENSEEYAKRRKGSVGDILAGNTSNYTNKIEYDISLIHKGRLHAPSYIIQFSKDSADWFTIWDSCIVAPYNKEKKPKIAMKRYIDTLFDTERRDAVFEMYDARAFKFTSLLVKKRFAYYLSLIKKQ